LLPDKQIAWISSNILPHEGAVRASLRRLNLQKSDIDDIIQEAYCRLAAVDDLSRIQSGRAYFYTVVRNIILKQIQRSKIVRIESLAEIETLGISSDSEASPEQILSGRQELAQVQKWIANLPERCRQVFILRKVRGLSQRETAKTLGLSENVVEKQTARGLFLILKSAETAIPALSNKKSVREIGQSQDERTRDKRRD